jgi:hypothetical protein
MTICNGKVNNTVQVLLPSIYLGQVLLISQKVLFTATIEKFT